MTTLDYSALVAPVTQAEITEFRRVSAGRFTPGSTTTSRLVFAATIVAGIIVLNILLSLNERFFDGGSTVFVIIATMLVAAGIFAVYRLAGGHARWRRLLRLSRFAEANGLTFTANGFVPDYPGAIFGIGSSRHVPERLSRAATPPVDFGTLIYTTGSGKHRTTHYWGYVAIKLDRRLPHMVLDAKSNNFIRSNLPIRFSRSQVLSLEGDFDRYFTLYCPQEYERDALYVFTPDLMVRLIDVAAKLDVEIMDDWMFLYSSVPFDISHAPTIARVFGIVDTVGAKAVDRTERYADDRAVTVPNVPASTAALGGRMFSNTIAPQGRRLRKGIPIFGIVVAVLVAGFWLLNLVPFLASF